MTKPDDYGAAVENVEVKFRYAIRKWDEGEFVRYDWLRDDGQESDFFFDSIEEAKADILH